MYIQSSKNREGGREETTRTKVKEVYKLYIQSSKNREGGREETTRTQD